VNFGGIAAETVTTINSTALTAYWSLGVPSVVAKPEVYFKSDTNTHWASISQLVDNNSTSAYKLDKSIQCSFAGGCEISITSAGLTSVLTNSDNALNVCNKKCELNPNSTIDSTKCNVPTLLTSFSASEYKLGDVSDYFMGQLFASNPSKVDALVDGNNLRGYEDSGSTCYFGTSFSQGFVGVISEVKIFMKVFVKNNVVGKLSFQGSSDGVTYTNIFTVDDEIHEGWNYFDYRENNLKYRFYRFYGTA
jgi:hypothetical protein